MIVLDLGNTISKADANFDLDLGRTCARRGDVRIVGLSSAPIPWPIGQRLPRGQGPVVGALV